MTAKALTAKQVENLKPTTSRQEIADGALQSLYLIIQPTGAKSWAVRYRHGGKPCKLTLGRYPELSLSDARVRAREALLSVSEGHNPAREKAQRREGRRTGADLAPAVFDDFFDRYVSKRNRPSYQKEIKRIIDRELKPRWKEKSISAISKKDVVNLLDETTDRGAPIMANRIRALLSKFFAWAIERDIVTRSPVESTRAPAAEATRERTLDRREIRLIWLGCEKAGHPIGPMVKLLLITAQRRTEIASALWTEIDLSGNDQTFSIGADRSKNRQAHMVPLSAAAVDIIRSLPKIDGPDRAPIFLFTTNGEVPVSGFSKLKAALDEAIKEVAESLGEDEPEPWRLHDLRRTAASNMAKLGAQIHVIEAVLNHRSGQIKGVAAVYNRYDYGAEKRKALTLWADYLLSVVKG